MSTPIEIVRAHIDALTGNRSHGFARVTAALASVLADAERFQALERAHQTTWTRQGWCNFEDGDKWWQFAPKPLAELADRLREGAT